MALMPTAVKLGFKFKLDDLVIKVFKLCFGIDNHHGYEEVEMNDIMALAGLNTIQWFE